MKIFLDLLNNATLLISMAMLLSFILMRQPSGTLSRDLINGLVFGTVAVLAMVMAVVLQPGLVFDGRSIVLSLAGLFGGPVVAAVAAFMAAVYRMVIGGPGLFMGIGVIVTSSMFGVAGHRMRKSGRLKLNAANLLLFGILVHLTVVAWMFGLPEVLRRQVVDAVALPMLLTFPLATVLSGLLLLQVEKSAQSVLTLQETQSRLLDAQVNAHIGCWWIEADTGKAYWADEIYRILGADPRLPAGPETLQQFMHPDDWDAFHTSLRNTLSQGVSHQLQYRILRPDGSVRWVDCRGKPVMDNTGKVLRIVGTFQDVTDRVVAEEHSRIAGQRLKKAQAIGHVGSWELDIGLNTVYASEEAFRIFGMTAPASGAMPVSEFEACIPESHRVHQALVELIETGAPFDQVYSVRPVNQDEEKIIASVAELIRDDKGVPVRVVGVIQDITAGKRAERALREAHEHLEQQVGERTAELALANEHLKELDRLKSMFIASMSHELRTPLNSVIGFTGMMLQEIPGPINARQRDYLERVSRAGRHLLALISDVIDIARIEAGKSHVFIERFDLSALIREAVEQSRADVGKKHLSLTVEVTDGVIIASDRRRLMQCLLNYLSNAVKYTPQGGITVRMSAADDTGEIEIAVSDTGIGIERADLDRLFRQFSRIDSAVSRRTAGTGLGLYLTRKLVREVLGGRVSVDSRPGEGSTFRLHLPKELMI